MTSSPNLRLHFDDRGVTRQLHELWIPYLDIDVVWVIGAPLPDDELARDVTPFVTLSASDVAAVALEASEDPPRVLALFCDLQELQTAAMVGLQPGKVTLRHVLGSGETQRISAEVHLDDWCRDQLEALEERGFTFEIQPLPKVTARPWSPTRSRASTG